MLLSLTRDTGPWSAGHVPVSVLTQPPQHSDNGNLLIFDHYTAIINQRNLNPISRDHVSFQFKCQIPTRESCCTLARFT